MIVLHIYDACVSFSKPPPQIHRHRIAASSQSPYHAPMPAIAFWLVVIVIVLFLMLTTRQERAELWANFWVMIVLLGVFGFAWQLLRQGHFSS